MRQKKKKRAGQKKKVRISQLACCLGTDVLHQVLNIFVRKYHGLDPVPPTMLTGRNYIRSDGPLPPCTDD